MMETDLKTKVSQYNPEHQEGKVAKTLERQTSKIPSDWFLWAAVGSMAASLTLKVLKQDKTALFIGQWAPSFMLLGIYNKLVKQLGHDQQDTEMDDQAAFTAKDWD